MRQTTIFLIVIYIFEIYNQDFFLKHNIKYNIKKLLLINNI